MNIDIHIKERLRRKSSHSHSNYKIAAVAFDRKGDILGYSVNSINLEFKASKRGAGIHAERELMERFGKRISLIIVARFGRGGADLPIEPCAVCSKVADKLGIRIISITE